MFSCEYVRILLAYNIKFSVWTPETYLQRNSTKQGPSWEGNISTSDQETPHYQLLHYEGNMNCGPEL